MEPSIIFLSVFPNKNLYSSTIDLRHIIMIAMIIIIVFLNRDKWVG
jgi:hypothetical protein